MPLNRRLIYAPDKRSFAAFCGEVAAAVTHRIFSLLDWRWHTKLDKPDLWRTQPLKTRITAQWNGSQICRLELYSREPNYTSKCVGGMATRRIATVHLASPYTTVHISLCLSVLINGREFRNLNATLACTWRPTTVQNGPIQTGSPGVASQLPRPW
jgi:hypothetical protein